MFKNLFHKANEKNIFIATIIIHFVAAIFSVGFHHFDEQFQILEYLAVLQGKSDTSQLAWEYEQMLRPWMQVYFYKLISDFLSIIGISSPFIQAFAFRLVSGAIGIYSIWSLRGFLKDHFTDERTYKISILLMNLTWFVPYVHVRPSSEGLSTSLFLIGFGLFWSLTKNKSKTMNAILSGTFWGLSYLCRFHLGIMVAPVWIWALVTKKVSYKNLILSAVMILVVMGMGVLVDYLGYQKWTHTPYNFAYTNLVLDVVSQFGISPWHEYFTKGSNKGIPPISYFLMLATLWGWIKYWKHPLTLATVLFFAIHTSIGHKELRFVFPVFMITPFYLALFIRDNFNWFETIYKTRKKYFFNFVIGLNFVMLLVIMLRPVNPALTFYKFISDHKISKIYFLDEDPFTMLGLNINFYKTHDIERQEIKDINEIISKIGEKYIFFPKGHYLDKMKDIKDCKRVFLTYPEWLLSFNVGNWVGRSRVWSLYRCQ